jgi:hypothetical protein
MTDSVKIKVSKDLSLTIEFCEKCEILHRALIKLIETHKTDLLDLGDLKIAKVKTKGRPCTSYILNHAQRVFLALLMKNSEIIIKEKKAIAKEYAQMIATKRFEENPFIPANFNQLSLETNP